MVYCIKKLPNNLLMIIIIVMNSHILVISKNKNWKKIINLLINVFFGKKNSHFNSHYKKS